MIPNSALPYLSKCMYLMVGYAQIRTFFVFFSKSLFFYPLKWYNIRAKSIENHKPKFPYRDTIPIYSIHHMNGLNLIKMQVPFLFMWGNSFVADWFGDYRGLRCLCGCFGGRTFLFGERDYEALFIPIPCVLTYTCFHDRMPES